MFIMRSVLLAAVLLLGLAEVTLQEKDATSTTEKVKRILRAVSDHCDVISGLLRRKRAASQKSEDKVRRLILNVVKDCLEESPPTYQPPVTEYTTVTTSTPTVTTPTPTVTTPTPTVTTPTPTVTTPTPTVTTPTPTVTTPTPTVTTSTPTGTTSTPTVTTPMPTLPPVYDACTSNETLNLDEYWRKDNQGSMLTPINDYYNCDVNLIYDGKWFRIIGDAGNVIRNECPPAYSCGTFVGLWTNAFMPTQVGQLITVPIYGSFAGDCDWFGNYVGNTVFMEVQRCSPKYGDFVYRIDHDSRPCYVGVCSMD